MNDAGAARESFVQVDGARLFLREIGAGRPAVVLHGGPDFSHRYLLPEMDALADALRLVYYDQRGRGASLGTVRPEDVTIDSEIEDLERVREHLGLERIAVIGHSWGAVLAMEHATRHPERVSHLILMNPAPASHRDIEGFRRGRRETEGDAMAKRQAIAATARYQSGDLEADTEYYRIYFRSATWRPEHVERVVPRLRAGTDAAGVRMGREIQDRLYAQTLLASDYDLTPRLARLNVPSLVLHGDHDLIPVEYAERIARAIPGARWVLIRDCGHFAYLERPEEFREAILGFLSGQASR